MGQKSLTGNAVADIQIWVYKQNVDVNETEQLH